jgi:hypothetical protein
MKARMAQWIRRLPTEQEIPGSSPGMGSFTIFQKITSGEDRTHANKVDQNLSLAP